MFPPPPWTVPPTPLAVMAGTLVLALVIAAWMLPRRRSCSPSTSDCTSAVRSFAVSESVQAPTNPPEHEGEQKPLPGTEGAASAPAKGGVSKTIDDQGEEELIATKRNASTEAAKCDAPAQSNPKDERDLCFYSRDGLWLFRVVAVRDVVDLRICGGHGTSPDPQCSEALKRTIWRFLDDRPRFIASGCADGQARIYDFRTGRFLVSARHDVGARQPVTAMSLMPGPVLLTGTWDGKKHTWETWPQKPVRPSEFARGEKGVGHDNAITGIALSRDGNLLACACTVGCVLVYRGECPTLKVQISDADEVEQLHDRLGLGDYGELYLKEDLELGDVELERNTALLKEADFSGCSSRRDLRKLELPATLCFRFSGCLTHGHKRAWRRLEHDGAVLCLALSAEGCDEFLYTGSRDQTLRKWTLTSGCCVSVYRGHTSMVRCLAINGRYLASGSDDRTVRVWKKEGVDMLRSLAGHTDFVRSVALCPTFMERLVSASDDLTVVLWSAHTGERLANYRHNCTVAAVMLRESVLLTAAKDGKLRVWRTEAAVVERQFHHPREVTALSLL